MKLEFKNLAKVSFNHLKNCASNDDLRPTMSGVFIDFENKKMVVTDAHIMMIYPIEIIGDIPVDKRGVILPLRYFNHLRYMIDVPRRRVIDFTYKLEDDFAEVHFGPHLMYRCNYIEGEYPKWKSVITEDKEKIDSVDSIGIDFKFMKKICDSIPFCEKRSKLTFYGKNKHIIFNVEEGDVEIKGILMPFMIC